MTVQRAVIYERSIIHEAIERIAEAQESLRVTRTELELLLKEHFHQTLEAESGKVAGAA